jgi:hypothetical protein
MQSCMKTGAPEGALDQVPDLDEIEELVLTLGSPKDECSGPGQMRDRAGRKAR